MKQLLSGDAKTSKATEGLKEHQPQHSGSKEGCTVKIIRQGEKILLKDSILLNEDNVKICKKLNIYQYSNYLNRIS